MWPSTSCAATVVALVAPFLALLSAMPAAAAVFSNGQSRLQSIRNGS